MDMTLASCREFVTVLASDAPAPGGGGAAALVGAIGTALANWDALGLFGAVLRVDGRVRAYNVASELLPDTADASAWAVSPSREKASGSRYRGFGSSSLKYATNSRWRS